MLRRLEDSPVYQLVKLKLGRMLSGAHADSEDMDAGVGVALVTLTLPGAFLSLLLFNKYGSLLRLLRGDVKFDPFVSSLPDEYLFIVLAMLVSGGVALWKWDALFLDRRDTVNIVPLPVRTRQIFLANFLAILLFATIFCTDVNAASAVLFPLAVSASQESFLPFGKIALGHLTGILAASLFSFAGVFAIAGASLALLSARIFQAISVYLRALIGVALLLLFTSAFTVPASIARGRLGNDPDIRRLPPMWFLGMCQWARGDAGPDLTHLAFRGLLALGLVLLIGVLAYGLAYKRHFSQMAELPPRRSARLPWALSSAVGRVLDQIVLQTSFEQAAFRFVLRTLSRSDRHRAQLAVFLATGLVMAGQFLMGSRVDVAGPTTAQFAAPLIVLYCYLLGLRFIFETPVELNANWIFRLLISPTLDECAVLAGKAIAILLLPALILFSVLFAAWRGPVQVLLEFIILAVLLVTLTAGLVLSFRKLPFTCPKAGFRQNALVKVLCCVLGLFGFAFVPANVEHWARLEPVRLLVLLPLLAPVWWAIYGRWSAQLETDRQIVFHNTAQDQIELLNLND